jgi:hypothetical protein
MQRAVRRTHIENQLPKAAIDTSSGRRDHTNP